MNSEEASSFVKLTCYQNGRAVLLLRCHLPFTHTASRPAQVALQKLNSVRAPSGTSLALFVLVFFSEIYFCMASVQFMLKTCLLVCLSTV